MLVDLETKAAHLSAALMSEIWQSLVTMATMLAKSDAGNEFFAPFNVVALIGSKLKKILGLHREIKSCGDPVDYLGCIVGSPISPFEACNV
jgi:hypothetical protein